MNETYALKAIILRRQAYREYDSKITLYSREMGKLDLVARGTRKMSSKLAAHIEPITYSRIMGVRGKAVDYVGAAAGDDFFRAIKEDHEKTAEAGRALRFFDKAVGKGEPDAAIFYLLKSFLETVGQNNANSALYYFFVLKLSSELGYRPGLYECCSCRRKISPGSVYFDHTKAGLACGKCEKDKNSVLMDEDCVKILRFALKEDFKLLARLSVKKENMPIISKAIDNFSKYHFNYF